MAGLLVLGACGSSTTQKRADSDVHVRHFNVAVPPDASPLRLFFFDPAVPRSLEDRVAVARSAIDAEPACEWNDAPPIVIAEATARLGTNLSDTHLVAPVTCILATDVSETIDAPS